MMKKILFGTVALALVIATVPLFAAFEAHVINVTAHIENALYVHPDALSFGTVFPQEYVIKDFTVQTSQSFQAETSALAVHYKIVQKPKPIWPKPTACTQGYTTEEAARTYCIANPSNLDCCYLDLCPFLSKTTTDTNDVSEPSYFVLADQTNPAHCQTVTTQATGELNRNDLLDSWIVDLKVPPVAGTVGQDWPAGCPTVPQDSKDYGCDLWIEVTGITRTP